MESSSVSVNKDGMEAEDVWSDLHALKRLYGLLQRTDGVMTPQGECLNIMDEKSRQMLKKLLDVATQEAIQCHSKIISKPPERVNPPEESQEEPKTNPSIDTLKEKTQEAEKPGKTEAKKASSKRAELKHQRSGKTMKTGSDLKQRKRSEHPLHDARHHRARSQPSSSGDPNRLRPSGFSSSSLMRNSSQLGRSSKRTRVDAPARTRTVLGPVDQLNRHRRVAETNSVQSQLSHRRERGCKLSGTSPGLAKKRLPPCQPKTEMRDSSRYQVIRVKPMRRYSSSRSESTFTGGTRSTSESDTVSRGRVPMLIHSEKRRPRRTLSQHKRVSPTGRSTCKEKKMGGGLKRFLKEKLALIFHHHHHYHHHHHHHRDEDVEVHRDYNHDSRWRYLRRIVRGTSKEDKGKVMKRTRRERVAERAPGQQRLSLLHVLLDALLRHVWGTQQRRTAHARWRRLGNAGKMPHWWQLFRRRAVGLKLANRNKPRLQLGFRRSRTRKKLTNING